MKNFLNPGDARVGHILDSEKDDSSAQVGVLTAANNGQIELALPYRLIPNSEHYARTRRWAEEPHNGFPAALLFFDQDGWVALTGLQWAGYVTGNHGSGTGKFTVQAAIFDRPRTLEKSFSIQQLHSVIDGLGTFSRFSPFEVADDNFVLGEATVRLKKEETVEWEANGFRYQISSSISWTIGDEFELRDAPPILATTHRVGASILDHIDAQRPVRALLVLVYGTKLSWRSHQIVSEAFPIWEGQEPSHLLAPVKVLVSETSKQHLSPAAELPPLSRSLLSLPDLNSQQLERWSDLYSDERFRRAVQPAVEVLNGATQFAEPQLMMLTVSLEYFGYYRFDDGKRHYSASLIQKTIDDVGLEWPRIGSNKGIAAAIARVNNDLKHPDRETDPSPEELFGLVELAAAIARAQVYEVLQVNEETKNDAFKYGLCASASQFFLSKRIGISDDGFFVRW